ncbi:MAG: hypothetical protein HY235_19080 [Acidobacteria bacterium]|nr:hypothetical protein [Acidobacteriota bacterium]
MAERVAEVVILAEDHCQESLVRRYLKRLGYENRRMRPFLSPRGRGSGEQFVREHFASEVQRYRNARTRRNAALFVIIDADAKTVLDRIRELDEALTSCDEKEVSPEEVIVRLIPRRNVETWLLCLTDQIVNEETDYKGTFEWQKFVQRAAVALFHWSRPGATIPPSCVDSLRTGLPELKRFQVSG